MKSDEKKYIDIDILEGWEIKLSKYTDQGNVIINTTAKELAKVLPAADVVEVRHGRWKNEIDTGSEMMACSVCGARVIKKPYISAVGTNGYAYCPYCGTFMDNAEEIGS